MKMKNEQNSVNLIEKQVNIEKIWLPRLFGDAYYNS